MAKRTVPDPRSRDFTGVRIGMLTATRPTDQRVGRNYIVWECRCDCGGTALVSTKNLSAKRTKNCGCTRTPRAVGEGREYSIWTDMKTRCYNPNSNRYSRYGARGIRVCERWHDFAAFREDMGPCPPKMSLDRINNDGDYEPGNCRWASNRQQLLNMSRNRLLTLNGRTMCLAEWALELGLSADVIYARIAQLGWSVERTLTTPLQKKGSKHHNVTS